MGEHEANPIEHWLVRLARSVGYRAKAFLTGILFLVAGELAVAATDPTVIGQVQTVVPPALVPWVPVVLAIIAGALVHAVPNGPKPGTEDS